MPSPVEALGKQAANSGSSLGISGPASSTVTRAPSRRCACAISMPIGPPPMMMRCSRQDAVVEYRLVGQIGHVVEAGDRRQRRREPVAITKRRGRISASPARDVARAGKACRRPATR